MESKIALIFVILLCLILVLIISLVLMFWKRFRKTGVRSFFSVFFLLLILSLFHFIPRHFKRDYLSKSAGLSQISFRSYADSLHFYIGSVGNVEAITNPKFYNNFNSVTPENELKMGALFKNSEIGEYDFSHADSIVNSALSRNIRVRGHALVWGKLSGVFKRPDLDHYLKDFPIEERSNALWNLMRNYITTLLKHYKGKIYVWDVVNEPLDFRKAGELEKNVYYRYLGENYIARIFRLAHSIDPDVKLYLNEQLNSYDDKRSEAFYNLVRKLKDDNVPINGVGIQSHIIYMLPNLDEFESYLQKFTALGLEAEITELDARLILFRKNPDPYKAQGEFYGSLLRICINNPFCRGITFWGFTDNHCWFDNLIWFTKPNEPYLFDKDMNPKPAFEELYRSFQRYSGQTISDNDFINY